jgi:hypothetical protein
MKKLSLKGGISLKFMWVVAIFAAVALALTFQVVAESFSKLLPAISGNTVAPTAPQIQDAAWRLVWLSGGVVLVLFSLAIAVPFIKFAILAAGLVIVWRSIQKLRGK